MDETAELLEAVCEEKSEEVKLPLMPSFVEQTSAVGVKLDSGIFEWAGSDADSNNGTNTVQSATMQELGEEQRLSVDDLEEQQENDWFIFLLFWDF